ncbi:hypothetical protein ACN27J_05955 [Solwaraspora sp. WMMB762]|uniref:hypothetical protein n=1 Tax=Solwaraspora sp. WMMB762 TaxID=3404120 RepID=UPI003B927690
MVSDHGRLQSRLAAELGDRYDQQTSRDGLVGVVLARSVPFLAGLRGWSAPLVTLRDVDRSSAGTGRCD